jgi:hypothetical protein
VQSRDSRYIRSDKTSDKTSAKAANVVKTVATSKIKPLFSWYLPT